MLTYILPWSLFTVGLDLHLKINHLRMTLSLRCWINKRVRETYYSFHSDYSEISVVSHGRTSPPVRFGFESDPIHMEISVANAFRAVCATNNNQKTIMKNSRILNRHSTTFLSLHISLKKTEREVCAGNMR